MLHYDNTQAAKTIYAILSKDENGNEGIITAGNPITGIFPCVGAERKTIDMMLKCLLDDPQFETQMRNRKKRVVIAEFTRIMTFEVL
jgi:hypothetical protein